MNIKDLQKRAIEIRDKYHDLEEKKYGKSWSTEDIAMGLVGDIGDLMKLIQAKKGIREMEDVDEKLAHELSDCLWCILVLSAKYDIDIEEEFKKTMDSLEERIGKEF